DGAKIDVQVADGRDLSAFGDGAFDIAHSNSVIEHVGLYADMQRFAAETMRVGRRYYLQTPYYWFPVEPHFGAAFIHWLPTPLRLKLVRRFAFAFGERQRETADAMQAIEYCNLIDKAMATSLFPEADVRFERLLLLPKSIIVTGGGPAPQSD
ncbi:MAG: class I SAM-dependent methyltransferase, partial [Pseudomonadota bacterium]